MTTYLLDFSQTPLQPAAGGQLHKVVVTQRPQGLDNEHDSIEDAIVHLVKSYGLEGETDTFVPLARPSVTVISGQGSFVQEVQVEPANSAVNLRPTVAEVLAAFPNATDIGVSDGKPRRTFRLHDLRFVVREAYDGMAFVGWRVVRTEKEAEVESGFTRHWEKAVRSMAEAYLVGIKVEARTLNEKAAALAAALGDAQ